MSTELAQFRLPSIRKWPPWAQYTLAVAAVVVALLVRIPLNPVLGGRVPFLTVFMIMLPLVLLVSAGPFLTASVVGLGGLLIGYKSDLIAGQFPSGIEVAIFVLAAMIATFTAWLAQRQQRHQEQANDAAARQLRQSEERSATNAQRLARLNALGSRLWQMPGLQEGMQEMLAATIEMLGADMGNVQLIDDDDGDGSTLRIVTQRGFKSDFLDFFREVSAADDSACGRALRGGQRIVIEDVEDDELFAPMRPIARSAGYRGVQSTPLIGRDGKARGMISTHWRQPHRPDELQLRHLDLYVRQATDFIERFAAEQALRDADRRKTEFLATLSHELRNPLAPIRNAIQILKSKPAIDGETQWSREVIDRQVATMARLLEDLLDVSRITQGKLELRRQRVAIDAVVEAALETSRPAIESAGVVLHLPVETETALVDADTMRLAQVLSNLLTNAAKFSERGASIWLSSRRDGDEHVVICVRDSGVGIKPEMLGRIFEMFSQDKPALERTQGGLGIGLALARELVHLHGGTIEARSEGAGKGSEFKVRLPMIAAPSNGQPAKPPPSAAVGAHEARDAAIKLQSAGSKRRVLVAEDNRDTAATLVRLLRLTGYEADAVHDGLQAIEQAEKLKPDVALLDIGLPEVNGYDVARHVRSQPWGDQVVLVAVTGWGQDEDKRRAEEAGFDRHLVKPVDPTYLFELLASLRRTPQPS